MSWWSAARVSEGFVYDEPIVINFRQRKDIGKRNASPEIFFFNDSRGNVAKLVNLFYRGRKLAVNISWLRRNHSNHVLNGDINTLVTKGAKHPCVWMKGGI